MAEFDKIGVVGAGMMGSEIALMFALSGLSDAAERPCRATPPKRAMERLHGVLDRGVPRGFWSAEAAETARRHLYVADSLDAYADRDLVIEAVFENEALKRDVFARLDAILPPEAGIASNTSSISITSLSAALRRGSPSPFRWRAFLLARLSHAACRGYPDRGYGSPLCARRRGDDGCDWQGADPG